VTTPPPQGNPFAQGQPQGQNPFAQGQAPHPAQGAAPYAPMQPERPKRGIKQYVRIAVVVAGLLFAAVGWYIGNDDTKKLAVGDCLTNKGSDDSPQIEQLDCSDSKADYKVLKKDSGTSLSMLACQSVEGTSAAIEWTEGSDSFVLCLGDNK